MPAEQFVSFAQNNEDVVLWRALGHLTAGFYVDVGANHPTIDSVSKAFEDAGWSGICVEPQPELAAGLRAARPDSTIFEGVISDVSGSDVVLHAVPGATGLSSIVDSVAAGHAESGREVVDLVVPSLRLDDLLEREAAVAGQIQFVVIDTEGAEADVLRGFDLRRWRPWVLVIESTAPNSTTATHHEWEQGVLDADYRFCLFDGLSRFYVATERFEELGNALSYPACVFDNAVPAGFVRERQHLLDVNADLQAQVDHWHNAAEANARARKRVDRLLARIEAMESSRSWRMTKLVRVAGGGARRALRR